MVSTKALILLGIVSFSVLVIEAYNPSFRVIRQERRAEVVQCYRCHDVFSDTELLNPCRHNHTQRICLYCYQDLSQFSDQCPVCTASYDRAIACDCSECLYQYSSQQQSTCYVCCEVRNADDMVNPCRHSHSELMCLECYQRIIQDNDQCPLCRASFDRALPCACVACAQAENSVGSQQYIGQECTICCEERELVNPCRNNHPAFICNDCCVMVRSCPLCREQL